MSGESEPKIQRRRITGESGVAPSSSESHIPPRMVPSSESGTRTSENGESPRKKSYGNGGESGRRGYPSGE